MIYEFSRSKEEKKLPNNNFGKMQISTWNAFPEIAKCLDPDKLEAAKKDSGKGRIPSIGVLTTIWKDSGIRCTAKFLR